MDVEGTKLNLLKTIFKRRSIVSLFATEDKGMNKNREKITAFRDEMRDFLHGFDRYQWK